MSGFGSVLGGLGGGAIGSAIVRLQLDAKQYQAQLAAAQGQTTSSANAMGTSVSKFSAIAKQGMLVAGAAVATFAVTSVKAAIEANEAHIKLSNTFANNAMLSDQSVEAFERQADAIRDLTGVDDELITSMQAVLGQFDLTGTQVMSLTPLVVDLSEKMGVTLEAAAKAVGKATQGSTGSLARYGIQIDATSDSAGAYTAVLEGLGVAQGFAAERAEAEPWRLLNAQFEEIQESVGQALLPLVQQLAKGLTDALPAIEAVIRGFEFLIKISPGLIQLLGALSAVMERLPHLGLEEFNAQVAATISNAPAFVQGLGYMTDGVDLVGTVTGRARDAFAKWREEVGVTQQRVANFARMTNKEIGEFREDVVADFDQLAGGLTNLSRKWALTAQAAVRATDIIAERQQQIARDLSKLDDLNIGDGLKEQLLRLGPDMVRAFISGNRNQRQKIRENLRAYDDAVEETSDEVSDIAHKGGVTTGSEFMSGAVQGILAGSAALARAAADAIHRAIAAARLAAEERSHSRVGMRIGADFILGIVDGLESEEQSLVRAAERAVEKMTKALEKQIAAAADRLSRVQARAGDLRSSLLGGFSSFLDISGGFSQLLPDPENLGSFIEAAPTGASIQDFFAQQVAGAEQFASILKALTAQGISPALLSQIAQAGPQAIPFAQQLLQMGPEGIAGIGAAYKTISDAARTTGGLTEHFFGSKIDELRGDLRGLRSDLKDLQRAVEQAGEHEHGSESEVINAIHEGLIRKGRRNGSLQLS